MKNPNAHDGAENPQSEPLGQPMDNPFDPTPGPQAPPEGEQKAFNLYGLRNSEPAINPRQVGDELALDVEWWQHLFAGFIKQSNSSGTEAWMHYVVAGILLADSELQLLDDGDREAVEDEASDLFSEDGPDTPEDHEG